MAAQNAPLNFAPAGALAEKPAATNGKSYQPLDQNETFALPNYLNRRGELSLVGPSGLVRESSRVRLDLRPDADRALRLRMIW
jgi:hypothetical protein